MKEQPSRATRKDVARLARVSEPVVSWVMSGTAKANRIPEKTALRIRRAARKIGYRPNIWGRLLKTQKSGLLAFISSDLTDPNTAEIVKSVNAAARRRQLGLMIFDLAGDDVISEENRAAFKNCFAEGFIIHSPFQNLAGSRRTFAGKPYCILGNRGNVPAPAIEVDNVYGGELAGVHLIAAGVRRLAVIADCADFSFVAPRLEGIRRAAAGSPCELAEPFYRPRETDAFEAGAQAVRRWQQSGRFPDGIFAMGDMLACGALAECARLGIRCPADVKIVGFDGTPLASYSQPRLTTIIQPFDAMAERAIDALVRLIGGERLKAAEVLVSPEIAVRESSVSAHHADAPE